MSNLMADLQAPISPGYKAFGKASYWARVVGKALVSPAVHAIVLYRFASALAKTPLRPLAFVVRTIGVVWSNAEIHPDATIGPGVLLVHSTGVVINGGTVIGARARICHNVSIGERGAGASNNDYGCPVLGDDVVVGIGAVVIGPVTIGDGAVIGANSVVNKDVPAGAIVGGIPARILKMPGDTPPSA